MSVGITGRTMIDPLQRSVPMNGSVVPVRTESTKALRVAGLTQGNARNRAMTGRIQCVILLGRRRSLECPRGDEPGVRSPSLPVRTGE